MNLICDFLVLAIVAVCLYKGKKNGAVKTFFSFFGNVISFLLTILLVKPVAGFYTNQIFFPYFKEKFLNLFVGDGSRSALVFDFDSLSKSDQKMLINLGIDTDELSTFVEGYSNFESEPLADSLSCHAMMPFAEVVGYACALISLFVFFSIVIRIVVRVLDLIAKVPGLHFANSVLGIVLGGFEGIFLAMLFATFMTCFAPAIQGNESAFISSFDPAHTVLLHYFSCFDWLSNLVLKG